MFAGEARPTGTLTVRAVRGRRTPLQWLRWYARSLWRTLTCR